MALNFPSRTPAAYKKTVAGILRLFENLRKNLVAAYWQTGRWIVEAEQDGEVRARYGEKLLENISKDLSRRLDSGFSTRNLERMRDFYLEYQKSSAPTKLGWTQHVELMPVRDAKLRASLKKRAIREGLTSRQIRALVRLKYRGGRRHTKEFGPDGVKTGPASSLLVPIKGKAGVYRVVTSGGGLQWDKGFASYRELAGAEAKGL